MEEKEKSFNAGWNLDNPGNNADTSTQQVETKVEPEIKKEEVAAEQPKEEVKAEDKQGEIETPPANPQEKEEESEIKSEPAVEMKGQEIKPHESRSNQPFKHSYKQKWKSLDGIIKQKDGEILELRQKLSQLESQPKAEVKETPKEAPVNLKSLYAQMEEARLEGDIDKVVDLQMQIEDIREQKHREALEAKTSERIETTFKARDEESLLNEVVAESITNYPFLDPKGKDADPVAIEHVRGKVALYYNEGLSRSEAVYKAVHDIAPLYVKAPARKEAPKEVAVDENKLKEMAVVDKKTAPVAIPTASKEKSFASGWNLK